jgi:transglutaminase-like putative cysteine protease
LEINQPRSSKRRWQGVCQDFAHIMIALVRDARISCRYVSGYLYHSTEIAHPAADGATHAWVEALLPGLGWVGFDPTINQLAREQHIRTATGRDYDDVPPTMGMMKGKADTELQVRVRVTPSQAMLLPQSAEAQQR